MTSNITPPSLAADGDECLADKRMKWHQGTEEYSEVIHDLWRAAPSVRSKNGPLLLMMGDSISRGYAFGTFSFDPKDTLSILQHPDRLFNALATAENGHSRAMFSGILSQMQIQKAVRVALRPGDIILYQDWGWRPASYLASYHNFASFASLVREFPEIEVCLMNSFATVAAEPQYDFSRPCKDDPRSPNDAIAEVAADFSTSFVDVASLFSATETQYAAETGLSILNADGVHPNPFGNVLLAAALYRHIAKRRPPIDALEPLLALYAKTRGIKEQAVGNFVRIADTLLSEASA